MKDHAEEKPEPTPDGACDAWYSGFKKKVLEANCQPAKFTFSEDMNSKWAGMDRRYLKRQLTDSHCIQLHNSKNAVICLWSEEYVETDLPVMPNNLSKSDKCVWDHKMNEYLKSKRVLKGILCLPYLWRYAKLRSRTKSRHFLNTKTWTRNLTLWCYTRQFKNSIYRR